MDNSPISNNSRRVFTKQFRTLAPSTPAVLGTPTVAKTPSSSISDKLLAIAQNFAPSILTSAWTTKANSVKSTPNGESVIDGHQRTHQQEGSRHILGLDAYLSNDEEDESDEEKKTQSTNNTSRIPKRQTNSNTSNLVGVIPPDEAKKRSHEIASDGFDIFVDTKRRKLQDDVPSSANETSRLTRRNRTDARRRFWESNHNGSVSREKTAYNNPTPIFSRPSSEYGYMGSTPSSSVATPAASRPQSQASNVESRCQTNLFSVPSRPTSAFGRNASSRTSSLSHSRPLSVASNHTTTPGYDFGQPVGWYSTETRRILKDMERAAVGLCSGAKQLNSSGRSVVNGPVVSSDKMGMTRDAGTSSDNAQAVSRLAMLGSTNVNRTSTDYSRLSQRRVGGDGSTKSRVSGVAPRSIVSSATIFRFAKPFPVMSEKPVTESMNYIVPPVVRFGNSSSSSLAGVFAIKTGQPTTSGYQASSGHVRFQLPPRRPQDERQ